MDGSVLLGVGNSWQIFTPLPGGQQPSLVPCHCHQYMANIVIDIATSIGNISNIVIILVEYCYLQYQYYLIIISNSE